MILIVTVDDNFGMTFNKRRQTKDVTLRNRILELTKENKLYVNKYTFSQFYAENTENMVVVENPMEIESNSDYCFIENMDVLPYEHNFNKIIVYYWNRVYPKSSTFNINLGNWECISEKEFEGNSHKNIKECIYVRKETANE